jgi:hypothetical protein
MVLALFGFGRSGSGEVSAAGVGAPVQRVFSGIDDFDDRLLKTYRADALANRTFGRDHRDRREAGFNRDFASVRIN